MVPCLMKTISITVLIGLCSLTMTLAGCPTARPDTTRPAPTYRRPVQVILPGHPLDTAAGSLDKPDPAVYRVAPKWLRAKAPGKPVYVIDGQVATVNQLKNLKVSAVASIEVMPGKRAVVRYGSVARDGMVAITTKAALLPRSN